MADSGPSPSPQDLQFQHAEPIQEASAPGGSGPACVACKQPVGATYFHAQGQVVCPGCAQRIQSGQQAPPALSLVRAALYGGGAALAGCILYALVAIVLNAEIGFVAILVGWMVGKAIRHASHGMGGRPQQILAIVLTYFAITTSYIPVMIYQFAKHPPAEVQQQAQKKGDAGGGERPSAGGILMALFMLAAAAPFFQLRSGFGGFISLFIIFIGLRYAWKLTGRSDILVMGPYQTEAPQ